MECGILIFTRCFQGLLVRRRMRQGELEWKPGASKLILKGF